MTPSRHIPQLLGDRDWGQLKMEAHYSRHNHEMRNEEWCSICGRSAVEEHRWRFHAAGGVLAGPYCSKRCAMEFLDQSQDSDNVTAPEEMRSIQRMIA